MPSLLSFSAHKAALMAFFCTFLFARAENPGSDAMALGVHEALRCPVDYQCADAVVFLKDPIYQLEPVYVTQDQVHTSKMTHTITSKTFVAKVTTVVAGYKGLCEQWVPTTIKTRPTLTVWRDVTTTAHYYNSIVETEELTHTHTVTQTSACMREIDRRPISIVTSLPMASSFGQGPGQNGSPLGGLTGGLTEMVEKEAGKLAGDAIKAGADKVLDAAIPEKPIIEAGIKIAQGAQEALKDKQDAKVPGSAKPSKK